MRSGFEEGKALSVAAVRRVCWLPATIAALACASPANAADEPREHPTFEITPFAGYMGGGEFEDATDASERDLDAADNVGVIFNIAADPWRHYEFLYSKQSTQLGGATTLDMEVQYLQIGGIVSHPDATRAIPYFGITVGAAQFSPDETGLDDETELSFSAGGGLRIPITHHVGLRFDARAWITLLDGDSEIFCVSSAGATCSLRTKSDTFLQYAATLGVTVGF